MSSFLVNFSNFFNARQERDARERAQQQQAAQFFAQLAQQKELAEASANARAREFDLTRQDAQQARADAQQAALISAQSAGLVRPAGPATDPLTGNPFAMKVVTDAASLANPFTPTTTLSEPGSFEMAGQRVMTTTPAERAQAMLPVEQAKAEMALGLARDEEKAKLLTKLEMFDANSKDIPSPMRRYWRAQIAAGKQVDPVSNLGEYAAMQLALGDYAEAEKAMRLQEMAYGGMSRMPSFNPNAPSVQAQTAANAENRMWDAAFRGMNMNAPARKDLLDQAVKNLDAAIAKGEFKDVPSNILSMARGRMLRNAAAFNPMTQSKRSILEVLLGSPEPGGAEASGGGGEIPLGSEMPFGNFTPPRGTN